MDVTPHNFFLSLYRNLKNLNSKMDWNMFDWLQLKILVWDKFKTPFPKEPHEIVCPTSLVTIINTVVG